MALNRREFVQLGAVGAAGLVTTSCKWPWTKTPTSSLQINIQGLVIVEKAPHSATVHLVDASKFSMMTHQPFLSVPAAMIDTSRTSAPSQPDPKDQSMRLFDLTNKALTVDVGQSGDPTLDYNLDPITTSAIPLDDAHWLSLGYAANLGDLCGATKISDRTKFISSFALEHGHLHSVKANSTMGRQEIWEFSGTLPDGTAKKITQVMTDTLVCDVPVEGTSATFLLGAQRIVVNLSSPGAVTLRHNPPAGMNGICKATVPCVDHMEVFYELVDAKYRLTARPTTTVGGTGSAEPDYCPPGTITP